MSILQTSAYINSSLNNYFNIQTTLKLFNIEIDDVFGINSSFFKTFDEQLLFTYIGVMR